MDYLKKKTNKNDNARVGKILILQSTFIGSPRYIIMCTALSRCYDSNTKET